MSLVTANHSPPTLPTCKLLQGREKERTEDRGDEKGAAFRGRGMGSHRVRHDWSDLACMHALEKEVATHSSVLAWRIPGTEEPGGLLSMGSHRVRHEWSNLAAAAAATHIYGIQRDGTNNPMCRAAKETQRTNFWTQWEKERLGRFKRIAVKYIHYICKTDDHCEFDVWHRAPKAGALW